MADNARIEEVFENDSLAIKAHHQYAIAARFNGFTFKQIAAGMKAELGVERHEDVIRGWFSPAKGGQLVQAYEDHAIEMQREFHQRARNFAARAQPKGVATVVELLESTNENVRLRAGIVVAGNAFTVPVADDTAEADDTPVSSSLMAEIEREREIIRLGEAALAEAKDE